MSTRDILEQLEELYGSAVLTTLISNATDVVLGEVKAWQSRSLLGSLYSIIYLDCLVVKVT